MNKAKVDQYTKMTETPVEKLILRLSVPTIISMMVTNVYNMVDTAFVGTLGTSASGAVGIVFGFMAILQAVGFMFGQGSGSNVSRLLGQKNPERASRVASTGFFCALALSLIVGGLSFLFLRPLVMLLGSTETIAPYAMTYISFILMASPFTVTSFVMNNILRYEGKAALGMAGLFTGSVLNIFGDALFMFVFHMGIAGAGLSTALSQFVSFLVLLSMFLRGKTVCRLSVRNVMFDVSEIMNICTTGLPSLLRQGLNSITTMLLNSNAAVYGDAAVAAMSIVNRVNFFIFAFALGIGQGYQPVSGFNYGAGRYSRVRKGFRFTAICCECVVLVIASIVFFKAGSVIQIFRNDPEVIRIGTRALKLQCLALYIFPFGSVVEMQFQSTGHKLGASVMSMLRSGICFIPSLLILSHFRGLAGIQEAQPVAYVLSFIPSIFLAVWFFRNLPGEDRLVDKTEPIRK